MGMEFIGNDNPLIYNLKNINLPHCKLKNLYHETLLVVRRLYQNCSLILINFNETNIIYFKELLYLILPPKTVELYHTNIKKLLYKAFDDINHFFQKKVNHIFSKYKKKFF